jgi:hypothetical protein
VFLDKDRAMENVQKHNICTNVPLPQILYFIYSIIAWTVKCLFLPMDLYMHSMVSCKICGEQSDMGAGFSANFLSFPPLIIIPSLLYTHLSPPPEI